jgi:quinolinate synthase
MNLRDDIVRLKKELGENICILGHHYIAQDVIDHCDLKGDSLELARRVEAIRAPHIVFCGVYFMAEAAALLARPGQKVYITAEKADCVMARMAPAPLLYRVLTRMREKGRRVVPLAYVNTSLAVKAVVGRFGGAACTSANAKTMLRWALDQGEQVLFLPDQQLGRNTAKSLGLAETDQHTLDIRSQGANVDLAAIHTAKLLLWPGCCAIHARFRPELVEAARRAHPGCRIAVHPECRPETVDASDAAGSTSFLIKYVAESPADSTLVIGTEISLVERLAREQAGRCTVLPLARSACSNMALTTEHLLRDCLRGIQAGTARVLEVRSEDAAPARESLQRMLKVCS